MNRLIFGTTSVFTFMLLASQAVMACSCYGGANPCRAFRFEQAVVFVGTVTEVTESNEKYGQRIDGKARRIKIRVDELFRGSLPSEIITSDDGYRCDNYPFRMGESYLVYAEGLLPKSENIVKVGLCSGTKPLEKASEDLGFLRLLKKGMSLSMIYGNIARLSDQKDLPNQPLGSTSIKLVQQYSIENGESHKRNKKDKERETLTDPSGRYSFSDVLPGMYELQVSLPTGLWMHEPRKVRVDGSPFCENHSYFALPDGRISGKVQNADGTPAAFLELYLPPANTEGRSTHEPARTDRYGNFTFYGVAEGTYKVLVGLQGYSTDTSKPSLFTVQYPFWHWYFPGTFHEKDASTIAMGKTGRLEGIDLRMPPSPLIRTVKGSVVVDQRDSPKNLSVTYKVRTLDQFSQRHVLVKEDGTFSFQIFGEFEYEVFATGYDLELSLNFSSERIVVNKDNYEKPLQLILKPKK